jgi:hypothetical protein
MVCAFAVYSQDQLRVNGATHSSIRGTHRARVATRYRQRPEDSAISTCRSRKSHPRGGSRLKENQGNILNDACHPPSACDVRRRSVQTAAAAGSREPLSSSPAQHRPPACTVPSAAAWERPGVVGMDVTALAKPA